MKSNLKASNKVGCKVFQIFEFLAKKLEASPQKCRFWEFLIKKCKQQVLVSRTWVAGGGFFREFLKNIQMVALFSTSPATKCSHPPKKVPYNEFVWPLNTSKGTTRAYRPAKREFKCL